MGLLGSLSKFAVKEAAKELDNARTEKIKKEADNFYQLFNTVYFDEIR